MVAKANGRVVVSGAQSKQPVRKTQEAMHCFVLRKCSTGYQSTDPLELDDALTGVGS
jgi:hypothetical protein